MKVLVLYGFHTEEREFGKRVCEEYLQRFSPAENLLQIMGIENSVPQRTTESIFLAKGTKISALKKINPATKEIASRIKEYKPRILIELHHSKKKCGVAQSQLDALLDNIGETTSPEEKDLLHTVYDGLTLMSTRDLLCNYGNMSDIRDSKLVEFLDRQTDLIAVNSKGIRLITIRPNFLTRAEKKHKTSHLEIEAMVNVDAANKVIEDDLYHGTSEDLIEFIHRVEGFAAKNY